MKQLRIPIHLIFYKEGSDWVAHCLEFDLAGDGRTKEDAFRNLAGAIHTQVQATLKYNNNLKNLFSPADPKYFMMFARGKDCAVGDLELTPIDSVTFHEVTTREYSESDSDSELILA